MIGDFLFYGCLTILAVIILDGLARIVRARRRSRGWADEWAKDRAWDAQRRRR